MEFWELTPYEFKLKVEAYQDRIKDEYEEKMAVAYNQAYWTALWMNGKKPDVLDKILGHKKEPKQMTSDDLLAQVKALNAALGGEVV